ncbi:MAG: coat protein B [Inoviridae sp.]|nr:MAG: coat protein B [Inoviridae sp.]
MEKNVVVESRGKVALKRAGVFGLAGGLTSFAMAAPDAAAITEAISGVETTIDATGGAMVTLFIGLMVFGVIIGMIARKGK